MSLKITGAASIAHTLAAVALEMAKVGRPPEIHFGWTDDSPVSGTLGFFLFGEGNVPWLVRDLIRRAEPDEAKPARHHHRRNGVTLASCSNSGSPRPAARTNPGRDLDLDPHSRVGEPGGDHHGRRPHLAEVPPQDRPALAELVRLRQHVGDARPRRPGSLRPRPVRPECSASTDRFAPPSRRRWSSWRS